MKEKKKKKTNKNKKNGEKRQKKNTSDFRLWIFSTSNYSQLVDYLIKE